MQSTGFAGRTITTEDDPLSARPQMAESSALADDDKLADRVHAPESGATPNLTDQLLDLLPAAVYVNGRRTFPECGLVIFPSLAR
jgi:hypothetical protein